MIPRGLKKKPATSPPKNSNPKKKSKSKSKSKSKEKPKKFSAQDFLQALIDLQNTNCSTNKKKRNTTRDVSSALTIATPALQKTISASKIRSRSSFSQYRKKCNGGTREPLTINLCAIITEEDNVQYTEKTARSSIKQQQNDKNIINAEKEGTKRINQNLCAIKIQRAWRNYQTYKMIHKIYLKQKRKKQMKHSSNLFIPTDKVHIKIHRPDFEKTLKIKKQHAIRKEQRKQQQFSQTQKIIKSRYRQNENVPQSNNRSPIQQMDQMSQDSRLISNSLQQDNLVMKIKQKQAERFGQVIDLIEKQRKNKSKEQLLIQLIQKFQQNKKILQNDINKHFQYIQFSESEKQQQNNNIESSNLDIEQVNNQHQNLQEAINNAECISLESSMCFDYQSMADEMAQFKIFQQRLKLIKEQKLKKLQKIDENFIQYRMTNQQVLKKKQQIHARYQRQKKQIQKNKKQFIFSLTQLKKNALKFQKQILKQSSSLSKLRKSFSAGNTILKQVLQDIKLVQIQKEEEQKSLVYLFKREINLNKQDIISKPLTNTPILILPSPQKINQSEQNLMDKNNTQVMKAYSQQIQQLIQKQLIDEFVKSAFIQQTLFLYFKPYVEQIYEFKKIQDSQVVFFLQSIKKYLPAQNVMLNRVNQKINPTSLQILRIIRDLEYEIDEYELIVPQDCFKKYRSTIEKQYQQINNNRVVDADQIIKKVKDVEIIEKVYKIELQKRQKMKKYSNFERDLKIMYMKSVFNCVNQFLIETKSSNAFMNGRSSIGPGQLSLAIKQYNETYDINKYQGLLKQVQNKIYRTIRQKCSIPSFKSYNDIQLFQKQVMKQIQVQSAENQFKWVNYMDEVLQIWQDLCSSMVDSLFDEAMHDIISIFE